MKKMIALSLVFVAAALVVACNQSSGSTPVAPQSTALSVSTERNNSTPVLLCHHAKGDDPAWIVIEVDNNSAKYKGHLRHGDYTTSTCSSVTSLVVGNDCTCCLTNSCAVH